jgi:hypothetical protein
MNCRKNGYAMGATAKPHKKRRLEKRYMRAEKRRTKDGKVGKGLRVG